MDLRRLSRRELLDKLKALALAERASLGELIAYLAEADRRRIVEDSGYPSLYVFCVMELKFPEGAAYKRIKAARAANWFPEIFSHIRDGELSVETVAMLYPFLKIGGRELIERTRGKSSREIENMLALLAPERQPADSIRVISPLPAAPTSQTPGFLLPLPGSPAPDGAGQVPSSAAEGGSVPVTLPPSPTSPALAGPALAGAEASLSRVPVQPEICPGPLRVRFSFVGDGELWTLLGRARELLRHKYPDGRLERIFKDALLALLERRDPERRLLASPPKAGLKALPAAPAGAAAGSRRIPAWVRRIVWKRDQGRCAYVSGEGRRCGERAWLEYDHVRPWALGGRSDDPANVRLLCRAHNQHAARGVFGRGASPRG